LGWGLGALAVAGLTLLGIARSGGTRVYGSETTLENDRP